jgi:hypothetical protein
MVRPMRIDTSSLLVAAQVQSQRPAAAASGLQQAGFEPLDFAKRSPAQESRQNAAPGAVLRPGSQLDIKI